MENIFLLRTIPPKTEEQKTEELKLRNWNRVLLMALVTLMLAGCNVNIRLFDKVKYVSAKELNAGPSASLVRKSRKDKKSPDGIYDMRSSYRIKYTSDTLKAEIGAKFGIQFVLFAETKGVAKVKSVWTFPKPMVNEKGKKFSSYVFSDNRSTHKRTFLEFVFREEFMLVKGEWKFELFHKRKKILEKVFYLI